MFKHNVLIGNYGTFIVKSLLLLMCLGDVHPESLFSAQQLQSIDEFIDKVLDCRDTPGLVVSIVKDDQTFTKAYGRADVKMNTTTTVDSIFCLASLTKAFTATLLSEILPEKYPRSGWDTTVKDILGDSFRFIDDVRTELTTVKDLLSHRTGLIRGDLGIYGGYPDCVTREQMVKNLVHLPTKYGFREKMYYSNWMYMLAGYIAEVLSDGESWESLINRKILKPLRMDSTVFLNDLKMYKNSSLAIPYRVVRGNFYPFPLEHYSFHPEQPAASLCSTGNDMIKWMQFLLNKKVLKTGSTNLANTSTFFATMQPHMAMQQRFGHQQRIPESVFVYGTGLGWVIGSYRGERLVYHTGALLASGSSLWLLPERKIGIFLATNRQPLDPVLTVIAYYLTDILTDHKPWLNLTTACTFPQPWEKLRKPTVPPNNSTVQPLGRMSEYIGTYGNKLFGDFNVHISGEIKDTLAIRYGKHFEGILIQTSAADIFSVNLTGVYWFLTDDKPIPNAVKFSNYAEETYHTFTFIMQEEFYEFNRSIRFGESSGAIKLTASYTKLTFSVFNCVIFLLGLLPFII